MTAAGIEPLKGQKGKMRPSAVNKRNIHPLTVHFFSRLVLSKIEGFYNNWWTRSKNLELSAPWVPSACQKHCYFVKKTLVFVVGRWVFYGPGYLCPVILDAQQGLSHNVTAVRSLNVQNGFWFICVGQPDLLELYNPVPFLWLAYQNGNIVLNRIFGPKGGWKILNKVELYDLYASCV